MYQQAFEQMVAKLTSARLLPLESQAELSTEILKTRLETVLPWAMERSGIDFWLVMSKEYCEDPIMKTLCTWDMPHARRISILAYHYDRATGKARAMSVGPQSPEMSKLYENVKLPEETLWECVARLVRELAPQKIGVERSQYYGFCDGLTCTLSDLLMDALPEEMRLRVCSAEDLCVRWLQKVTPIEKKTMEVLSEVTQDITKLTFNSASIQVGKTTTTDLEWLMRNTISRLGFSFWFGPDIDLQREGGNSTRMFHEVIQPGDLLHCDVGILGTFVQLNTDMQWVAYVRKPGEEHAPEELCQLLAKGNRFQDIVASSFKELAAGNDVFAASIAQAKAEGLKPMLYTHPLGTFGHGAGPTIGRYDHQAFVEGCGERPVENETCYALELNVHEDLALWGGQEVYMYLEEDIYFNENVQFVHGRQTEMIEL